MIKCFVGKSNPKDWSTKYNFVDSNNVVVGYDANQQCCENAYYNWLNENMQVIPDYDPEEIEDYNFNTNFLREGTDLCSPYEQDVLFKVENSAGEIMYLRLANCHNGWYSHGYQFSKNGKTMQSGYL